ncbi:MAG: 2-hydroxychromene-2-carboxylate isomerase [Betaproteobacteria bacterium]|nr:2-hydroxychromene-2-carboxylate isomerase [Betaproteobacteria bacterium]
MHSLTFYFDVISPYAYLAFDQLPRTLQGLSYQVRYQPVLFGGLLNHHGQLGPVEVAGKREWTYRQSLWLAKQQGLDVQLPAAHPFNPLPLLRLAIACDTSGQPNRHVCEAVFKHVWCGGLNPTDPDRLAELTQRLQPARSPDAQEVKDRLRHNTEQAIADGVFGVPSIQADGEMFWGLDALPMLREYLQGDDWYRSPAWTSAVDVPAGIQRKR